MRIPKNSDNEIPEFIKRLISFTGFYIFIGLLMFSLCMFSLKALLIPSIVNLFLMVSLKSIGNLNIWLLNSGEGSTLGLLFGMLFIIIYCKKYYPNKRNYFFRIERQNIFIILFLGLIIGFIIPFFNRASGFYSIIEYFSNVNIAIEENTAIGQILSDWKFYESKNNLTWANYSILTILIVFMDIFISFVIGIFFASFSIFYKFNKNIEILEKVILENSVISKKEIIINSLFTYVVRCVFIGLLIGLVYGIIVPIFFKNNI